MVIPINYQRKKMIEVNEFYDTIFEALRKILYPEELIDMDLCLSKTELMTLLQVERNGEIIMSQIANYINIPMSTATGVIDRLVRKGYMERTRSESDRRIVAIRLTGEGKRLAEEIKGSLLGFAAQVLNELTDDEKELLLRIISKVTGVFPAIKLQDRSRMRTPSGGSK
jgi:DNA-binding MarR family transcriptional regulator